MPVSTTPTADRPKCRATELKRGSAAGRTPHIGGLLSSAMRRTPRSSAHDAHVQSARGEVDVIGLHGLAMLRLGHRELAHEVEPRGEALREARRHVLHDEHRGVAGRRGRFGITSASARGPPVDAAMATPWWRRRERGAARRALGADEARAREHLHAAEVHLRRGAQRVEQRLGDRWRGRG